MKTADSETRTHPTGFRTIGTGLRCTYACVACPKRWESRAGGTWRLQKLWWCPDCTERKAREREERKKG